MGGKNTIVLHNTCEDSLLAAPIILDLVLLAELSTRIQFKAAGEGKFHSFHPVATILSYLTKAPLVPPGTPVVNALSKQRAMLENILRASIGLAPENNMILEYKTIFPFSVVFIKAVVTVVTDCNGCMVVYAL
ncbi:hypothetical protein Gohar_018384, partial [Gossypium harknessii]|nr:hypothetical protein [Gossypium harknessii]